MPYREDIPYEPSGFSDPFGHLFQEGWSSAETGDYFSPEMPLPLRADEKDDYDYLCAWLEKDVPGTKEQYYEAIDALMSLVDSPVGEPDEPYSQAQAVLAKKLHSLVDAQLMDADNLLTDLSDALLSMSDAIESAVNETWVAHQHYGKGG